MAYVTFIDSIGLTHEEYRAVLDRMGVERRPRLPELPGLLDGAAGRPGT